MPAGPFKETKMEHYNRFANLRGGELVRDTDPQDTRHFPSIAGLVRSVVYFCLIAVGCALAAVVMLVLWGIPT